VTLPDAESPPSAEPLPTKTATGRCERPVAVCFTHHRFPTALFWVNGDFTVEFRHWPWYNVSVESLCALRKFVGLGVDAYLQKYAKKYIEKTNQA